MSKLVKKMALQGKGRYKLEQRAEEGQVPYGWHIHWDLTLDAPVTRSVFLQQVYQGMKMYVLYSEGYTNIDIKQWGDHHEDYINGIKMDSKKPKVAYDKILRAKLDIPEIISY